MSIKKLTVNPLRYALSALGLAKAREAMSGANPLAVDSYIRDLWSLGGRRMTMVQIESYWNLSLTVAGCTDIQAKDGFSLTRMEAQCIQSACRRHLPAVTDLELVHVIDSYNGDAIEVETSKESLLHALDSIAQDKTITTISQGGLATQRLLVSIAANLLAALNETSYVVRGYLAENGYLTVYAEDHMYLHTPQGNLYY